MSAVDPARVLAALGVLGWPDDREMSAHVEPDGFHITPAGHYWGLVESVIRAADEAATRVVRPATGAEETQRAIEEGRPGYVRWPGSADDTSPAPPLRSTAYLIRHFLRRPRRREEPPDPPS